MSNPFTPFTDELTGAMVDITYEHHEIHEGSMQAFVHSLTLGGAATEIIRFTTPPGRYIHLLYQFVSTAVCTLGFYENTDITGAPVGAAIHLFNRNRAAPFATSVLANIGITLGGGGIGTELEIANVIANKKVSGGIRSDHELVLHPDMDYSWRIITPGGGGGDMVVTASWYEKTRDVSI